MEFPKPQGGAGRPFASLLIAGFLALQLLLPLRGCIYTKHDSRANFSWNMYSQRFQCQMSYLATYADGPIVEVDHGHFFHRRSRFRFAFHRDTLPAYHAYLCQELRKSGELVRLEGICLCSHNQGEYTPLVRDDVDFCTAENYGVLER